MHPAAVGLGELVAGRRQRQRHSRRQQRRAGRRRDVHEWRSRTGVVIFSTDTFALNQWYHVAMTWDGNTVSLYVDGNLEASQTVGPKTILYTSDNAAIGRHSHVDRSYDGLIDEVEIFNRALSSN